MPRISYQQYGKRGKEEYKTVDDDCIKRHWFFPHAGIGRYHLVVVHDTFIKVLERIDGLLEDLYYGYSTYIFHRFGIHIFE